MKTVMMTASLHRWGGETGDGPALEEETKSVAWRGGEVAGPLLGDLVRPPPAALHHHRGLASSLSVDTELRT